MTLCYPPMYHKRNNAGGNKGENDMRIKIEGSLDESIEDIKLPGWIAVEIRECSTCDGSGYTEPGSPAHPPVREGGKSFPATDPVRCDRCFGAGHILHLDTAILCDVSVTVTLKESTRSATHTEG